MTANDDIDRSLARLRTTRESLRKSSEAAMEGVPGTERDALLRIAQEAFKAAQEAAEIWGALTKNLKATSGEGDRKRWASVLHVEKELFDLGFSLLRPLLDERLRGETPKDC